MFDVPASHCSPRSQVSAPSRKISAGASLFCIVLGMAVLLGWALSIEPLKRLHSGFPAMNPLTAVCFMLCGSALAAGELALRRTAGALGGMVLALGAVKLVDLAFGSIPVDQLIFSGNLNLQVEPQPNRMAPNTALAFMLIGAALCTSQVRKVNRLLPQMLTLAVMLTGFFALVGYILGIEHLGKVGPFIPMALSTAIGFQVLGIGLLSQGRKTGIMRVIHDCGPAGSMFRMALPLALVLPVIIGAARLWGQEQGFYDTEFGIALQVVTNIVISTSLLLWSVMGVYRKDVARNFREQALRDSEQLNRVINDVGGDAVAVFDSGRRLVYVNEPALRTFGAPTEAELAKLLQDRSHPAVAATEAAALRVFRSGEAECLFVSLVTPDKQQRSFATEIRRIRLDGSGAKRLIVTWRDLTVQRRVEEQALWNSNHDELTRLPNRGWFQQRLETISASRKTFAVLLIDVDHFKQINDSLGHLAGDALLRVVATRIRSVLRADDEVARLGGDEFGVILHRVSTVEEASSAAQKILAQIRQPWVHAGCAADCAASIGLTIAHLHGRDPSELLRNADLALFAAKSSGGHTVTVYAPEARLEFEKRLTERRLAQAALDGSMLFPFYQPKIELRNGRVAGFEALLRWRSGDGAIEGPSGLAAAFDDPQLAAQMTDRMLTRVVDDMSSWIRDGVEFGHIAFNATALDLSDHFAAKLFARLDSAAIPRDRFQVEVTETVFLGRSAEYVRSTLLALCEGGIRIALDDFGTGFSSLSHLRHLPIDIIKIDRSFLSGLEPGNENAAIVNAVIGLGRNLRLDVVAEGVETSIQEKYLVSKGCRYGQGFLYSEAVPAMRVPSLIRQGSRQAARAASSSN